MGGPVNGRGQVEACKQPARVQPTHRKEKPACTSKGYASVLSKFADMRKATSHIHGLPPCQPELEGSLAMATEPRANSMVLRHSEARQNSVEVFGC